MDLLSTHLYRLWRYSAFPDVIIQSKHSRLLQQNEHSFRNQSWNHGNATPSLRWRLRLHAWSNPNPAEFGGDSYEKLVPAAVLCGSASASCACRGELGAAADGAAFFVTGGCIAGKSTRGVTRAALGLGASAGGESASRSGVPAPSPCSGDAVSTIPSSSISSARRHSVLESRS